MDSVINMAAAIVAIAIPAAIVTFLLRLKAPRELSQRTRLELEESILRYERDYFDYIGHAQPDDIAFKNLVATKDIKGIQANWSRLSNSFLRLEMKAAAQTCAQHGRPNAASRRVGRRFAPR